MSSLTDLAEQMTEMLEQTSLLNKETVRLTGENTALKITMCNILVTLNKANEEGVFIDTIWHKDAETLYDYIYRFLEDDIVSFDLEDKE